MKKKLLSILLAVIFVFSMLTFIGCGGTPSKGKEEETGQTTGTGQTTDTDNSDDEQDEDNESDAPAITDCVFTSFVAQDFDNNIIDETVFADYKVTMINVWGTFCSPCIKEVPDLAELNAECAESGFQVIGILIDGNKTTPTNAKQIAANTGADYMQLKISNSLKPFVGSITSFPHTVFVNSDGRQIGDPYSGSKSKDDWKKIIDELIKFADE